MINRPEIPNVGNFVAYLCVVEGERFKATDRALINLINGSNREDSEEINCGTCIERFRLPLPRQFYILSFRRETEQSQCRGRG